MASYGPRLATTLFSFSREYHARRHSFDGLVEAVAGLDLGPGLEIDGFQSIHGYPHISGEFERHLPP